MGNTERLGLIWKPRAWGDGETVPRLTLPDATLAEAMAALGYAWDANAGAFARLQLDASGNLKVAVTGAGSGGTSSVDGSTWTAATSAGTPVMGARDDASPATVAEDKLGIARITTNRALHVNLRDAAGNELSVGGGTQYADGSAQATPTGTQILAWDGANERALKGDQTNGLFVNVKTSVLPTGASTAAKQPALGTAGAASADVLSVQGVASMTALKVDGSGVTQPVSGTVTANAGTGTLSTNQAQVAGTTTDTNSGNKSAGTQRVVLATDQPALTNALKVDGSAVTQPVSGTVTANLAPTATGGLSKFHLVAAATTNATNVKASAGQLYGWYIYNSNAAARKVAFHNTSGTPTAGTSVTDSIVIPPGSAANAFSEQGIAFSTGIAITTVTGLADSDSAAVAANDLIINLYYK